VDEVSAIAVYLKSPVDKVKVRATGIETPQAFTWVVTNEQIKEETLEISKTSAFKTEEKKIYKAHQAATAPLVTGPAFWRVGWIDKGKTLYTEARQITIEKDTRLELTFPENNTRFDLEPEEAHIEFQWRSQVPAKVYLVEVATTPDFKKLVQSQSVSGQAWTLKEISSGSYFWRVRAFGDSNQELAASASQNFTIKIKLPKLPELLKPSADILWEENTPIEFGWKKMEKAVQYRLTISKDPNQKEIVKTQNQSADQATWAWKNQGSFYWSVTALDKRGIPIGQSDIRLVNIKLRAKLPAFILVAPKPKAEVLREMSDNTEPVLFQWQTTRQLPGPVTLVLSTKEDFSEPLVKEGITQLSQPLQLNKAGTYYWKLLSRSADKTKEEKSESSVFILKGSKAGLVPIPIEPGPKENIEVYDPTPVKFSWKPVAGVTQYHLVVERRTAPQADPAGGTHQNDAAQAIPIIDRIVKETTFTSTALQDAQYTWRVSALDSDGQEGPPCRTREFRVILREEMAAPKLKAPVIK
jgi:hypothetical protein